VILVARVNDEKGEDTQLLVLEVDVGTYTGYWRWSGKSQWTKITLAVDLCCNGINQSC
jgi:hypothetical protein